MPLTPGQKLSVYEVLEPLGAGAMGEVWRARDPRLQRDVAIKVLPEHFAEDEERLRRFEREARALASLNHSNVAQIFGVDQVEDTCFLVLELVEGETLEDRLARGPLPVRDAIDVGRQIAAGLEAAHEAGVIHRDLKPANVRITPEGKVKVLDFGLAKPVLSGKEGSSTDSVLSTEAGRLLGTPTYMAPEQARGRPIDRRVDVWAFGCVLFECLVGRRTFDGESLTDVLAGVLEREPDWGSLPALVPARVRRLLERCLTKEPYDRLRDAGDARLELAEALTRRDDEPEVTAGSGARLAWSVAAVASAVALWLALGSESSPIPAAESARRLALELPPDTTVLVPGHFSLDVSDDGRWVVFNGLKDLDPETNRPFEEEETAQLYVRELGSYECMPLPGTEHAEGPFFSPDAEWIAFFDWELGKLRKIPRSGGTVFDLCDSPENSRGGDWSQDGTIVFSRGLSGGLYTVSEEGGESTPVVLPDRPKGEKSYRHPAFLPGGDAVLATLSRSTIKNYDEADIVRVSLATGAVETVLQGGATPRYATSGHLLFGRAGELHAVAFDPETGRISEAPFAVLDDLLTSDMHGTAQYAVSANGTVVYLPGGPEETYTELVWLEVDGTEAERIDLPPAEYSVAAVSPDGTRLAISTGGGNDFLTVHDLRRGTSIRLVTSGWDSNDPIWSSDGDRVIFPYNRSGTFDLYWRRADGSDAPELLLASDNDLEATFATSDGKLLVYQERGPSNQTDVLALPLDDGGRTGDPVPILTGPYNEANAVLSPDGGWLAYQSDESDVPEIYVRPFPEGVGRWQVSHSGGVRPSWSKDGSRLRYHSAAGLVEVDLSQGPERVGDERLVRAWGKWMWHSVVETPEGERLLGLRATTEVRRESVHVVLDLFTELGSPR